MYFSGSANSYNDLLTALVSACTGNGWTWVDNILSKGTANISFTVRTASGNQGPGIVMQGGTGKSGAALVNPSPSRPRMGPPSWAVSDVVFPVSYNIHLFTNPDEVFMVVKYNTDRFIWLSFGISALLAPAGAGLWLSALAVYQNQQNVAPGGVGLDFTATQLSANGYYGSAGGPFFRNVGFANPDIMPDAIHVGLDGLLWGGSPVGVSQGAFTSAYSITKLLKRAPSAWNQETPLIPIQVYLYRPSNLCTMVLDISNARYVRLDNYNQEQIITLGADQWKVYPFYKKNTVARDGGAQVDHTGTFGWAIRYDGP